MKSVILSVLLNNVLFETNFNRLIMNQNLEIDDYTRHLVERYLITIFKFLTKIQVNVLYTKEEKLKT